MIIKPKKTVCAELIMPGDKSIFHRAAILASLAKGVTTLKNIPDSLDCQSTMECLRLLGTEYTAKEEACTINGKSGNFNKPSKPLYAGNSGTTARLISGVLAGQTFSSELCGDDSLSNRPMGRIISPLLKMGANIGKNLKETLPIKFFPAKLNGIKYSPKQASAQVKSCLLFAGLLANGNMSLTEKIETRAHLENLFSLARVDFNKNGKTINMKCGQIPFSFDADIPGDFSSAAYFIAIGLLLKDSRVKIKKTGLNPARIGFLNVLKRMGAEIKIENICYSIPNEPCGDITVNSSELKGADILPEEIPSLIDELPLIAVVASNAKGITSVSGAQELHLKESDRIKSITKELKKMGANIEDKYDGFTVSGRTSLKGASLSSHGDHRIAMSLSVAATLASDQSYIEASDCVNISFPNFFKTLLSL